MRSVCGCSSVITYQVINAAPYRSVIVCDFVYGSPFVPPPLIVAPTTPEVIVLKLDPPIRFGLVETGSSQLPQTLLWFVMYHQET